MNVNTAKLGKDGHSAFSVFKRRVGSVMAFVMNRNFLFFVSAIVLVALAACGKGDEETAVTTTGSDKGAVAQPAPATDSGSNEKGPDLVKSLRENSGVTSPEEKAAAIERARGNAVAAAKSVGQTDQQAQAAGEAAAATARRSFDEREPQ